MLKIQYISFTIFYQHSDIFIGYGMLIYLCVCSETRHLGLAFT